MANLLILSCSTRPGRKGPAVAQWFEQVARRHGAFEIELLDLADVNLPMFDEPEHPRLQKYEHQHTKAWSARVSAADAFVFVTPEYNFSPPPSLLNALDYLYNEWNYKAAGFVSYGGLSGGMRSVEITKHVLTTLKVVPIVEAVAIPTFSQYLAEDGRFVAIEAHHKAAESMLTELGRWTKALAGLRK